MLEAHPGRFRVVALATGSNAAELEAQARRLRPAAVAIADDAVPLDLPEGTHASAARTPSSASRRVTTWTSW